MDEPKKRNRGRKPGSLRYTAGLADVSHTSIRTAKQVKQGIKAETQKPWVTGALKMRGSIVAAKSRGEWTAEDNELALGIIAWLLDQTGLSVWDPTEEAILLTYSECEGDDQ